MEKELLISLLFLLLPFSHYAKTIEVCGECQYTNIQEAVNASEDGDTIFLKEGIYFESKILVDKSIALIGIDNPVVDAQLKEDIFTITSPNVLIKDLTLKNVPTSYISDFAAIRIKNTYGFEIRGNTILNSFFGIYIEHSDDGTIIGNKVIGEAELEMSSGNAILRCFSGSEAI